MERGQIHAVVTAVRAVFGQARAVPVVEIADDPRADRDVVVIARRAPFGITSGA